MKLPRFKARNKVKVITIYRKNFSLEEEENWDNWYLDKIATVLTSEWNETMGCYEYQCDMVAKDENGIHRSENFYEFELDLYRGIPK